MIRFFFLVVLTSLFLVSCSVPSVEEDGGMIIEINSADDDQISIIKNRFQNFLGKEAKIESINSDDKSLIKIVDFKDRELAHKLMETNSMIRIVRAIPTSTFEDIANYLSPFISKAKTEKPYKSKSTIGLVDKANVEKVDSILTSSEFKNRYPFCNTHFYGVKEQEGKKALFIEDSRSTKMEENMFEVFQAYQDKESGEGEFSIRLKEEYNDRIGQLTGNDSTYLLHLFHDEVYISKIIVPHITSPSFGMSGAFTYNEAKLLSAIWKSEPISSEINISNIDVIEK